MSGRARTAVGTCAWLIATALVVLGSRALAYALAPQPSLIGSRLEYEAGGPRLVVLALAAIALALVPACARGLARGGRESQSGARLEPARRPDPCRSPGAVSLRVRSDSGVVELASPSRSSSRISTGVRASAGTESTAWSGQCTETRFRSSQGCRSSPSALVRSGEPSRSLDAPRRRGAPRWTDAAPRRRGPDGAPGRLLSCVPRRPAGPGVRVRRPCSISRIAAAPAVDRPS